MKWKKRFYLNSHSGKIVRFPKSCGLPLKNIWKVSTEQKRRDLVLREYRQPHPFHLHATDRRREPLRRGKRGTQRRAGARGRDGDGEGKGGARPLRAATGSAARRSAARCRSRGPRRPTPCRPRRAHSTHVVIINRLPHFASRGTP